MKPLFTSLVLLTGLTLGALAPEQAFSFISAVTRVQAMSMSNIN